jgi:hypothetical protein
LNYWLPSPSGGVSIVVLVALLSPIVIMVFDGVALGGFYIVEGHGRVGARVEIGAGLGCLEGIVGVVDGGRLEGMVSAGVEIGVGLVCLEGMVGVVVWWTLYWRVAIVVVLVGGALEWLVAIVVGKLEWMVAIVLGKMEGLNLEGLVAVVVGKLEWLVAIAVIVVRCPIIIVVTIVVGCPIIIVIIAVIVFSFVVDPVGVPGPEAGPSIFVMNRHDCLFWCCLEEAMLVVGSEGMLR